MHPHCSLILEYVSTLQETQHLSSQSRLSHPPLLIITNLLCGSTDLPMLTILYKWNPQTYGLLCLASSRQHNVFKGHLHCIITSFLPMTEDYSSGWIYHICLSISPHRVVSTLWQFMNNTAVNIRIQIFV